MASRVSLMALCGLLLLLLCMCAPALGNLFDFNRLDSHNSDRVNDDLAVETLSAWRPESPVRSALLRFVEQVERLRVPDDKRIATFDVDGTLLVEKPNYFEVITALHILCEEKLPARPDLINTYPYNEACPLVSTPEKATNASFLASIVGEAFSGLTEVEVTAASNALFFEKPTAWAKAATRAYTPMVQLVHLLRKHRFQVYLVTGSQQSFVRGFASFFGLPQSHVIGSRFVNKAVTKTIVTEQYSFNFYEFVYTTEVDIFTGGVAKVAKIAEHIGAVPLLAAGNTGSDAAMLEYVRNGNTYLKKASAHQELPRLALLVDHDDAEREFNYSFRSSALYQTAQQQGWLVASMRDDFARVFD